MNPLLIGSLVVGGLGYLMITNNAKAQADTASKKKALEMAKSADMKAALTAYFAETTVHGRSQWYQQITNTFFLHPVMTGQIINAAQRVDADKLAKGQPLHYPGSQTPLVG